MALVVRDRVKETTATAGTGTLTLAGAVAGFQAFSAALSNGDTTYYALFESSTGEWEVGLGTFALGSSTLARTTILASSNAGSAINLTAGSAEVFITQPAGKTVVFDASGNLTLNQDPTANLQAATKQYVDTIASASLHYHDPVRVEEPNPLTVTYNNGTSGVGATLTNAGTQAALVLDGVTMVVADRVLIYVQADATQNGIYTVTNVGSGSTNWVLTRATDADSYSPSDPDSLGQGDAFFVREGNTGAGELYVMNTEGTITFGTTDITFAQVSSAAIYTAGDGLTLTGVTFAVGAGTGVTVGASSVSIGQDVSTSADVTFNTVTASLLGNATTATTASGVTANSVALGTDTTGNYVAAGAVSGSGLSGSASSEGATFTVTSNATNANTGSTIVFRDASGNFSAGTITANLSGNATTATTATTANSVAANSVPLGTATTGNYVATVATNAGLDGSGSGEGSAVTLSLNLSELTTSTANGDGDFFVVVDTANAQRKLTKGNINISGFNNDAGYTTNVGDITGVTAGSFITGGGTSGTVTINVDATSANTASKVVARDGSGNFSAGTITANLTGTASNANTLDGWDTISSGNYWGGIPIVGNDGVMEVGKFIDFHATDGDASDYTTRLEAISGTDLRLGGSKIWTQGNDGSGSGLDADLLDGIDSKDYSRKVMETATGGPSDSNYWAKIATYTITGNYNDGTFLYFFMNEESNSASSAAIVAITVRTNNVSTGQANSVSVSILGMHQTDPFNDNAFKLLDNGSGTAIELWVQKNSGYDHISVYEHSAHMEGVAVAYNNNAAWQVSEPVGTGNNVRSNGLVYRNNKVWNAGNDGAGSGLDADTLDGVQGSNYLRLDTNSLQTIGSNLVVGNLSASGAEGGEILFKASPTSGLSNPYIDVYGAVAGTQQFRLVQRDSSNAAIALFFPQVAGTVWSSGNDGAGSGLDADLLDGVHGSSFLRSDTADSTASTISFTGSIEVGNQILHHGDTNTYMQFHAADQWRVVTGNVERLEATNSGVRINNAFTLPTTDGTSGQGLVTDGSGTVTWGSAGISTGKAIAMAIVFG